MFVGGGGGGGEEEEEGGGGEEEEEGELEQVCGCPKPSPLVLFGSPDKTTMNNKNKTNKTQKSKAGSWH